MATVKIVLYTSKVLSDGNSPIMIRLMQGNLSPKYIRIGDYSAKLKQWEKGLGRFKEKSVSGWKKKNRNLEDIEREITEIKSELEVKRKFTYDNFRQSYFKEEKALTVGDYYNIRLEQLLPQGRGYEYEASYHSIITKFNKGKDMVFSAITKRFLQEYERQKIDTDKCSQATVSHYLRPLRAIIGDYLYDYNLPDTASPFHGRNGYVIKHKGARSSKKAMNAEQLKAFIDFDTKGAVGREFAKSIFLFSFYTRGMNLTDIAHLTKKNIHNGQIQYRRSKTGGVFTVKILEQARVILKKHSSKKYLFPIMGDGIAKKPEKLRGRIKGVNRNVNRGLSFIGKEIGVPDLSFYWARHTWATLAKKKGYSTEKISEGLGHSSISTTAGYLESFGVEELDNITESLL